MLRYVPVLAPSLKSMGQALPAIPPPVSPGPDPLFTGYSGVAGFIEAVTVLTVTGAAAWVGIRAGLGKGSKLMRTAGWVGGVGSAIMGVLYMGGKSGYVSMIGIPAVRITPS